MKTILGVNYKHLSLEYGDTIYITNEGLKYKDTILPDNFLKDKDWFKNNSEQLTGTSIAYKVRTKPAKNKCIDIVIKWNRMGEDIPGEDPETSPLNNARFLSPFEEFQYLYELKNASLIVQKNIVFQEPLAVYLPSGKRGYRSLRRKKYLMNFIQKTHIKDISIDIDRYYYLVMYKWIEGINACDASKEGLIDEGEMDHLRDRADLEINDCGFTVRDNKASHIILTPKKNNVMRDENGDALYGYVDYELLERTPERENAVRKINRKKYLSKMPKRFEQHAESNKSFNHAHIFQVPYIYEEVPSSKGKLWIVGNDTSLFDYFLPEKWGNMEQTKLSPRHEIYHILSKDNINLVLKVSKVGQKPDVDPFNTNEMKIYKYGFNSPFEEFAIAIQLNKNNIPSIYPRAIYMSGKISKISERYIDNSRYISHSKFLNIEDENPILKKDHEYIMIWGYWNGTDEMLADHDGKYYTNISALCAFRDGIITRKIYFNLMTEVKKKLISIGIIDLNLRGTHILLSFDNKKKLIMGENGLPKTRICNFELLKTKSL